MPNDYDRLSRWLLLIHVVLVALTFRDYGLTWDEGYHLGYGAHIARFFGSGFQDLGALTYRLDYLYGGGFDLLGAIVRGIFPWMDRYEAVHLLGAALGVLGLWGAWSLGRRLAGPRAGFCALVMLSLTHVYYGHMFNNPKDLPFAVGYIWALDLLVAAIYEFPRVSRGTAIKLAIAMGMAMSVRIGGLLLLCYFGAAIVAWSLRRGLARRSVDAAYRYAARLALQAAAITAGAWAIMLVWWPWAMLDPLRRPLIALTRMSSFVYHRRKMPFDGEWISTLDTPPDYLLHYFAYKIPEAILFLFTAGVFGALAWLVTRGGQLRNAAHSVAVMVLGLALFFPPIYAVIKGSVLYDGLRHFLFLVPVMAVVAAVTYEHGTRWLIRRLGKFGAALSILAAIGFCGEHVSAAIRFHPHHYVWFNHLAGGLEGVVGRYSTDYYGETFKETVEGLTREVWRREPEAYVNTIYKVSGCLSRRHVGNYMPANFIHQTQKKRPDFWVGYTRDHCSERYATHPALVTTERDGGFLNVARDVRRLTRRPTPLPKPILDPSDDDDVTDATGDATGDATETSADPTHAPTRRTPRTGRALGPLPSTGPTAPFKPSVPSPPMGAPKTTGTSTASATTTGATTIPGTTTIPSAAKTSTAAAKAGANAGPKAAPAPSTAPTTTRPAKDPP